MRVKKELRPNLTEAEQREALARIEALLKEAQEKIEEACDVADEFGVQFRARFINASNTYTPMVATFNGEDPGEAVSVEDDYGNDMRGGWQHSDFCVYG